MTQQRLPIVNSDDGQWGAIIRQYLMKEHFNDDTDNPTYNGGHQNITIRPGSTTAAPLTFVQSITSPSTTAALLSTPVDGSVEYAGNAFYITIGTTRKRIAIYDDSAGAAGDLHYRDGSGNLLRLPVGTNGQVLRTSGGLPAWGTGAPFTTNTQTTSYTITASDTVIFANATSAAVTITLPSASSFAGYRFYVKRIDSSANTCTIAAADMIDGAASVTLNIQYQAIAVVSNSSAWYIL